ncbi:hypothetical protein CHARACLAT_030439 [Characodon lateralis]|uniref:Uncharacterized protein n=1 Tax=Characodon lateralis TaxID=208331 RepID=A0ABU7D1Y6_9TELE|nr:hypothetical protein [Characodon lateralis]
MTFEDIPAGQPPYLLQKGPELVGPSRASCIAAWQRSCTSGPHQLKLKRSGWLISRHLSVLLCGCLSATNRITSAENQILGSLLSWSDPTIRLPSRLGSAKVLPALSQQAANEFQVPQ